MDNFVTKVHQLTIEFDRLPSVHNLFFGRVIAQTLDDKVSLEHMNPSSDITVTMVVNGSAMHTIRTNRKLPLLETHVC